MTDVRRCPDCGEPNPPERESCLRCNFPFAAADTGEVEGASAPAAEVGEASDRAPAPAAPEPGGEAGADAAPGPAGAAATGESVPAAGAAGASGSGPAGPPGSAEPAPGSAGPAGTGPEPGAPPIVIHRRLRPRRPRPASNEALTLWLLFSVILAATVIWIGVKANVDRARQPVEGSTRAQQEEADRLAGLLARDSTDVEAHVALGNLLYDTGNWSQAIVHYRAALRRDSTRVPVIVDLGVCYYNLGLAEESQRLFGRALDLDPHHPVALFNLGVVSESRSLHEEAFEYYHRALRSAPPDEIRPRIVEAMQRVQEAAGKTPPPMP